ncbi:MAG: peptidylprolyl isomerase [Bradymonadaceae bacterium]
MFFKNDRLLALIVAGLLATTVACDSSAPAEQDEEGQTAEATEASADESATAEDKDVTKMPFYATGAVAVVDGVELEASRFNVMAERRTARMPGNIPGNMLQMYKKQTLEHVVDEYLIDRKLEQEKIEVTDAQVEEALVEFKSRFPSEEYFAMFLEQNQLDEAGIRENLQKDVALQEVISKTHDIEVKDEDVRAYYDEHQDRFKQQDEVHARHILIKVEEGADEATIAEAKTRAEAILKEVKASGADFEELAKTKSEGPSAPRGGDLGFFPRERMVPEFSEVAFKMKAGQISDVVKTAFGFHIIQVVEKRDARQLPFEEVKEHIEMQLKPEIQRQAFGKFLAEIKEGVKIELKEDAIVVNVPKEQPAPQGMGMPPGHPGGQPGQLKLDMPKLQGGGGDDHAGHDH